MTFPAKETPRPAGTVSKRCFHAGRQNNDIKKESEKLWFPGSLTPGPSYRDGSGQNQIERLAAEE
jgi:hypothetical protein